MDGNHQLMRNQIVNEFLNGLRVVIAEFMLLVTCKIMPESNEKRMLDLALKEYYKLINLLKD
jgi:hypothetical protein